MAAPRNSRAALAARTTRSFSVRPGIEIRATGDLTLDGRLESDAWRFEERRACSLCVRAMICASIVRCRMVSTAVTRHNGFLLTLTATPGATGSWPALTSMPPIRWGCCDAPGLAGRTGNFDIAAGIITPSSTTPRMVRTGTGTIEVAAAGNIRFGNQASVLYTAGVVGDGIRLGGAGSLKSRVPHARRRHQHQRAVATSMGAQSNQLVTDWLWRTGRGGGT